MNSKLLVKKLNSITPNKNDTKKILITCYKNIVIKDKIYIQLLSRDIKNFLKWLHSVKKINIDEAAVRIKKINMNKSSKIIKEKLGDIWTDILGDNDIKLRMEYNTFKILDFMKKYYDEYDPSINTQVHFYFDNNFNDETFYDDLNDMFEYERYITLFENHRKFIINKRFKDWSIPSFKIVDKYNIEELLRNNNQNIEKELKVRTEIVGDTEEAEQLQKINKIVQGGLETRLKEDFDNLENIAYNLTTEQVLWNIKDVWKDQVFKYLKINKKRPGAEKRTGLYIYTVFLVLNKPFDEIVEVTKNSDQEFNEEVIDKNKGYATKMISEMLTKGYLSNFSDKFKKHISIGIDLTPLKEYLRDEKNLSQQSIDMLEQLIIQDIDNRPNITKNQLLAVIYRILKDNDHKIAKRIIVELEIV